ncbi:hypothetical protein XMV233_000383 [Marinobacterium sp. xm-v-233]|nr:hypothetical protein [Marinobacterium sp. xm-v-233]
MGFFVHITWFLYVATCFLSIFSNAPYDKVYSDVHIILVRGTHEEVSLEERVEEVREQILTGKALIMFDSKTETTTIIPAEDLAKIQQQNAEQASE